MRRIALLLALTLAAARPAGAEEMSAAEKLTIFNCGRCHVVGERNRMGGIGSTPSFMALRALPDWEDRMRVFWTLRPHPAFTQIEGVTDPFPPNRPSPIHPIRLTEEDVAVIVEYARGLEPKDLGADIRMR